MTEDVLQYIWQTQSFSKNSLNTNTGEPLRILKQGMLNQDSGPDFSSGRVIIENVELIGDIEIHVKSSAWSQHNHQLDLAYNKVILHVVWEHDEEALRADGTKIPTLTLKPLVSKRWLHKCRELLASMQTIPCQSFLPAIDDIHRVEAFSKALIERLERKSRVVLDNVARGKGDWEQAVQDLLFEYFGFKKNNEGFKQLSSVTEYKVIQKLNSQLQVEAYLFGMAGLLPAGKGNAEYQEMLINEFAWIRKKFRITRAPMAVTWWKFMRLRPANFPTLRIAQLAALIFSRKRIFQAIIESSAKDAASFFMVKQSTFWQTHYHFNKEAKNKLKGLGEQSALILSINVAAVLLVGYGHYTNNDKYIEQAINFLEVQKPEANIITRRWQSLGVNLVSAAESQGAIELFNNYCRKNGCLQCNIGNQILHNA